MFLIYVHWVWVTRIVFQFAFLLLFLKQWLSWNLLRLITVLGNNTEARGPVWEWSWWAGNREHYFCSHWPPGPYDIEQKIQDNSTSCLLEEGDELFTASLGSFQWLLLQLIQAASAKIVVDPCACFHACKWSEEFVLLLKPLLSFHVHCMRGLLTWWHFLTLVVLPSRRMLQEYHAGYEAVNILVLCMSEEKLQKCFTWTVRVLQWMFLILVVSPQKELRLKKLLLLRTDSTFRTLLWCSFAYSSLLSSTESSLWLLSLPLPWEILSRLPCCKSKIQHEPKDCFPAVLSLL